MNASRNSAGGGARSDTNSRRKPTASAVQAALFANRSQLDADHRSHIVKTEDLLRNHLAKMEEMERNVFIGAQWKASLRSIHDAEAASKREEETNKHVAVIVAERVSESAVLRSGRDTWLVPPRREAVVNEADGSIVMTARPHSSPSSSALEERPVWGKRQPPPSPSRVRIRDDGNAEEEGAGEKPPLSPGRSCHGCDFRDTSAAPIQPVTPASVKVAQRRQQESNENACNKAAQEKGSGDGDADTGCSEGDARKAVDRSSPPPSPSPRQTRNGTKSPTPTPTFQLTERTAQWRRPWAEPPLPLSCDSKDPPPLWNHVIVPCSNAEQLESLERQHLAQEEERSFEHFNLLMRQDRHRMAKAAERERAAEAIRAQKEKEKQRVAEKRSAWEAANKANEEGVQQLNRNRLEVAARKAQQRDEETSLSRAIADERMAMYEERKALMHALKEEERIAEEGMRRRENSRLGDALSASRQRTAANVTPLASPTQHRLSSSSTAARSHSRSSTPHGGGGCSTSCPSTALMSASGGETRATTPRTSYRHGSPSCHHFCNLMVSGKSGGGRVGTSSGVRSAAGLPTDLTMIVYANNGDNTQGVGREDDDGDGQRPLSSPPLCDDDNAATPHSISHIHSPHDHGGQDSVQMDTYHTPPQRRLLAPLDPRSLQSSQQQRLTSSGGSKSNHNADDSHSNTSPPDGKALSQQRSLRYADRPLTTTPAFAVPLTAMLAKTSTSPAKTQQSSVNGANCLDFSRMAFPGNSPKTALRDARRAPNSPLMVACTERMIALQEVSRRAEERRTLPFMAAHRKHSAERFGRVGSPTKRYVSGEK